MTKRLERITEDSLSALYRHHPYLLLLQKEDWRDYLLILTQIYDLLEEERARVPLDTVRPIVIKFYAGRKELSSLDQKIASFFAMAIGELEVLKDSHDQFGQRYIETTRSGKALLQWVESLVTQRAKFSGTGAELLLGALNDILISQRQPTLAEAIRHHQEKIAALREDLARMRNDGLAAAQLLPITHSNEALFSQAEEAAIHILQSIEDVKAAIEQQRKALAANYFQSVRSAGETLGAVADFYDGLYSSPQYVSYIQAKELLSHLEGLQARFAFRNVDRLLHSIEQKDLIEQELIKRSNLRFFSQQFSAADFSIQEKIKAQLRILQQQVLYSVSTDVMGLRVGLHALIATLIAHPDAALNLWEANPLTLQQSEGFEPGAVSYFEFELPLEVPSVSLSEEGLDLLQERELLLALLKAEEGTLKDILHRLRQHLAEFGELRTQEHSFPRGLAEYYVLSEIDLFYDKAEKIVDGVADLRIESKYGQFILVQVPVFTIRPKEGSVYGSN